MTQEEILSGNPVNVQFGDDLIFTTGAYLVPILVHTNDRDVWMWVVSAFEDDTFKDGTVFNPPETSDTIEELLTSKPDEEE